MIVLYMTFIVGNWKSVAALPYQFNFTERFKVKDYIKNKSISDYPTNVLKFLSARYYDLNKSNEFKSDHIEIRSSFFFLPNYLVTNAFTIQKSMLNWIIFIDVAKVLGLKFE